MTNQNKKYFYFSALLIAIYIINKGRKMNNKFVNFTSEEQDKLNAIYNGLIKAGLKEPVINFALSQILWETGRFSKKSNVAKLNNNYSGIKYICKPYQIATKGSLVPKSEQQLPENKCTNFYAKFDSIDAYCKDYVRILSIRNKPINATTIEDYNDRLFKNSYYGITPSSKAIYLKGLKYYLNLLK